MLFYLTEQVLLINPCVNVFVLGDFDVHYKDWLTYSCGTDRPDELCYVCVSNDLTQIFNFPTWIPGRDSQIPALLDLLFPFDVSICSTMAFPPFLIMLLCQFPLTFHQTQKEMSDIIA